MAVRNYFLRALNICAKTVSRPQIPGNPLNLYASSKAFPASENHFIQFRNVSGTSCLQTETSNICESLYNKDNMTAKETSGSLPNIVQRVDSESTSDTEMEMSNPIVKRKSVEFSAVSDMKVTKRHDLAMVYTCKVCETRSVKAMSRESYEKGIVIVRCSGCNNLHLIADRLGWFGEPSSVEDFLRRRGEKIRRGSQDSYELTLEELAGWKLK